jgi:hypothetical protein
MFVGLVKFPVTQDGEFVGAILARSEFIPSTGHAYVLFPRSTDKSNLAFYIDAMLTQTVPNVTASNKTEFKRGDANSLLSVTSAFDFVAGHIVRPQVQSTRRTITVYATVDKNNFVGASTLQGASLGLAFVLAFMGFELRDVPIVFTGYVNSIGMPEMNDPLKHVLVQPIDAAGEKVAGCMKANMFIFLPEDNRQEVDEHMRKMEEKMKILGRCNNPYASPNRAIFVRTVEDVVRILDEKFSQRSRYLENSGYYNRRES